MLDQVVHHRCSGPQHLLKNHRRHALEPFAKRIKAQRFIHLLSSPVVDGGPFALRNFACVSADWVPLSIPCPDTREDLEQHEGVQACGEALKLVLCEAE